MDKVRLAIIGTGVMGQGHLANMAQIQDAELTAVCDTDAETLRQVSTRYPQASAYDDYRKLLAERVCDAVVIATPHYDHPVMAIDCFRKGVHVLSEKPLAVTTKAGREAVAVHKQHPHLQYAIMFMARLYPQWITVKEILDSGRLGEIRRVSWTMTNWFRTQAYYDSGGWRATWAGEGGGVLINQCPHTMDVLTWLAGLPVRVSAQVGIGRHHRIEVEDSVNALLEYENGAIGHFHTSTGESPGTDRLEIIGDRGRMVVEGGKIILHQIAGSVRQYSDTTADLYRSPQFEAEEITPGHLVGFGHTEIVQNFVDAILRGEPLVAPAEEGLRSLSLGNALLLSGLKRRMVEIPFDDEEYAALIEDLAARSVYRKEVRKPNPENFADAVH